LPKTKISDERRRELAEIFSAEKPLGDYIDEDREGADERKLLCGQQRIGQTLRRGNKSQQ
jgi:hypothetical protein